jgi:hypothetical protein
MLGLPALQLSQAKPTRPKEEGPQDLITLETIVPMSDDLVVSLPTLASRPSRPLPADMVNTP